MNSHVIWVALGGALGALMRYGLGKTMEGWNPHSAFSAGILTANVLGCFLMGMLVVLVGQMAEPGRGIAAAFLLTGFLGSLTTFSTFILEFFRLAQEGGLKLLLMHAAAHLVAGSVSLWGGYSLAHKLWNPG